MNGFIGAAAAGDFDLSKYFKWLDSDYSIGNAALVALIGIVIVLLILLVLVGLLMAFNKIFGAMENRSKKSVDKKAAPIEESAFETIDDEETVAAIVAAISCIYAEESGEATPPPFTVRRIRQIKNSKR